MKDNQPGDPERKPSSRAADDPEQFLLQWLEAFGFDDEGDWRAAGWDEDPYEMAEQRGIPRHLFDSFLRSLPRLAWAIDQYRLSREGQVDRNDESESLTRKVWQGLAEVADASGTWEDFASPPSQKAEERRYDLTKLLLLAPMVITIVLLAMVAFSAVTANDAVLLAAALLGPLYMPLGAAVGFHYNTKVRKPLT